MASFKNRKQNFKRNGHNWACNNTHINTKHKPKQLKWYLKYYCQKHPHAYYKQDVMNTIRNHLTRNACIRVMTLHKMHRNCTQTRHSPEQTWRRRLWDTWKMKKNYNRKIWREKDTWKTWVRIEGKYYAIKRILENKDTMKNTAFIWSAAINFHVPHNADNFLASRRTVSFWKITTQHRVWH